MDESTADRLLDWIDSDSEERIESGEQNARNSVPIVVDELAWLQNQGEVADTMITDETIDLSVDSSDRPIGFVQTGPSWLNYLTVHSAQRNETHDGQARIDLNSIDLQFLHQQVTESLSLEIANHIVAIRQYGVLGETDSSSSSTDAISAAEITIDFNLPATFQLDSLAQLLRSVVMPVASGQSNSKSNRLIVRSPIELQSGSAGMQVDEVFDVLAVNVAARIPGQIDIATAPAEVIAAIPGLDMEMAQEIVASREAIAASSLHPIGILSSLELSPTNLEQILPHVTIGGDVVRVLLSGSVGDEFPTYRCEAILDASYGDGTRQAFLQRLPTSKPTPTDSLLNASTTPDLQ